MQMLDMKKVEVEKFNKDKSEALNKKIAKITEKQELEISVFQNKINQMFSEFKKNRALETEK